MENQPIKPSPDEKDIDLGVLFKAFIEIAHRITSAFRKLFDRCLSLLVWFLLFLRRRILLLLTGLLLSLVPGLYMYLVKAPRYYSVMTVKVNFESAHNLYNKVDYFNSLIQSEDNKKIAELFNISEIDADKLIGFEITPFDNDIQAAALYKKYFYETPVPEEGQAPVVRDTTWSKLITFKDFKNSLQVYDFPLHQIKLISRASSGYSAIQAGFISAVSQNNTLQRKKQIFDSTNQEQTRVIRNSLSNADSLMRAFNKQIATGPRTENGANLTVSAQQANNPEIEIFDETLKLKNELGKLQQRDADHLNVLDVYADFNDRGTHTSPFKESFQTYFIWCLLGTIVLLLLFEVYIAVDEKGKKKLHA